MGASRTTGLEISVSIITYPRCPASLMKEEGSLSNGTTTERQLKRDDDDAQPLRPEPTKSTPPPHLIHPSHLFHAFTDRPLCPLTSRPSFDCTLLYNMVCSLQHHDRTNTTITMMYPASLMMGLHPSLLDQSAHFSRQGREVVGAGQIRR